MPVLGASKVNISESGDNVKTEYQEEKINQAQTATLLRDASLPISSSTPASTNLKAVSEVNGYQLSFATPIEEKKTFKA